MAITWKVQGVFKADAEKVYREITSIGEKITPEQIVEVARSEDTELHKCFIWDDTIAAHRYRLNQAQMIIRNIARVAEYEDEEGKEQKVVVRAIVSTGDRKNTYETITRCIEDPNSFKRLLESFLRDLEIFKRRYENYAMIQEEYSDLFTAIDAIIA